ncbi:MAG: methyltransferase domain-containing protein [Clostridiales bacterium]|nr:methyltransferase domain-containing protein [Clostridiales bacterium]
MTMIRPGGEALTKKAIELAGFPDGARVLDVGCGEGDTVRLLKEQYGFDAVGIDASNKMVDSAKARHPGLDLRVMEAEFLDFESNTFDAVLMECFLSVARLQPDASFEAYCTLKPGGKLILTDLYRRNPDPAKVAAMLTEAHEKARQPKVDGACGENSAPSFVMLDGAFVVDELAGMLEETGFEVEYFSDETAALAGFAAQAIMGHGSLTEYFQAVVPEGEDPAAYCACGAFEGGDCPKDLGYFLMILRKRGDV